MCVCVHPLLRALPRARITDAQEHMRLQRPRSPVAPLDGWVRRADDAMRRGPVLVPEGGWQLGRVVLQPFGSPILKRRQRDDLRLSRAIWPRPRLGKVLLVIIFSVVEECWVVGGRCSLRGNGAAFACRGQGLGVSGLARFDERLLLVIKPVEARAVLRPAVVALSHAGARVVCFPKPAQDINEADLRWVKDDLYRLGVPRLA
mmetsp:Transcript_73148/g.145478  ORF Transcript_73148/g.145478 Transcript_73148/m.145478 type:complete len:203 (+) Transcript_73148:169-777(+)